MVQQITVSISKTRQIKQFEPTIVQLSTTVDVKEGEDLDKLYDDNIAFLDNMIEDYMETEYGE